MKTIEKLINILLLFSIAACDNGNVSTITTTRKQAITYQLLYNSSYILVKDFSFFNQYKLKDGDSLVFIYQKEGVTFVDVTDYEARYKELLLFQFAQPDSNEFVFKDTELKDLKCLYLHSVLSKYPTTDTVTIKKGTISGKRIDNINWQVSVDIDTDYKYGGYLDKLKTYKIKFNNEIKASSK